MELFYRIVEAQCPKQKAKNDLIIVHGLFGMSDNWLGIAKSLSKDRKIIIPDLRNHGRSPHTNEFSIKLLIEDIVELMEKEKSVEPILLGHSLGGRVVAEFAFQYPNKVSKIIIADMNLGEIKLKPEHQGLFLLMKNTPLSNMKSIGEIDLFLKKYVESERIRMLILKNIHKNNEGVFEWKLNFPILMEVFNNMMPKIEGDLNFNKSSLLIRGGKSEYVSDDHFNHIQNHFKNIELVTIDNASHWLHVDKPEELIKTVESFIK